MTITVEARTQGQSLLLSLPDEILSLILQYYNRPWSLYVPYQYRIAEHNSGLKCGGILKTSCDVIPSRGILLVCRQMYKLAAPLFQCSFYGKIKVSLADEWNWQPFRERFVSLLAKVHTLEMDVSHVNLVYQTSRPVPSVGVDLPKPEKILMRDKFQVVNLGSHFASQENGLSALFSEEWCARPETKQCKRIAEEIVYKRLHTTGVVWLAASMLRGTPGHGPRTVAQVEYKFQFKNKNMPGIYV